MSSLLEMRGITKRYPGVLALDAVDFTLASGQVHALVGENGAGKSTLIKILAGAAARDAGSIRIDGRAAALASPAESIHAGIGIIYQDFKLVPQLSVAENILLGREPRRRATRLIDRREMNRLAESALAQLDYPLDVTVPVHTLGTARQQMVEIARAISRSIRILAMDEPTASLTGPEIDRLFQVIRALREHGVGVIYISHRLEEIFAVADRVTVLRDGCVAASCPLDQTDRRGLIRWMVGREMEQEYPKTTVPIGGELLRLENIRSARVRDVSLGIRAGEILGLAGLVGAGRSELARLVFGADPRDGGCIFLAGREIRPRSPAEAIEAGLGLLTEDRNRYGLIMRLSVRENISLASLRDLVRGPFINRDAERRVAERYASELHLRPPRIEMAVEELSGGNRQKVVLARWLNTRARVLIFDEPTAGIDVGVKYEIYQMIGRLAGQGLGILLISSDLPELLGLSDRVAVMRGGSLTGILDRAEATPDNVMALAAG